MKWIKGFLGLVFILLAVAAAAVVVLVNPFGPSPLNNYTKDGNLTLPGLKAPVTVHRDEKGMAYIYAGNMEDLLLAQGFVTAQDRLFQMELTRLFASGRIGELAGEKARGLDVRMRTLGFYRNAKDSKRWVIYNGEIEASRVSPEWHGWLHRTWDEPPTEKPLVRKDWEQPHQENLTGTLAAYAPSGSLRHSAPAERSDYEAWSPE